MFLISTIKFLFAPLGGPGLNLSYGETYFASVAGALLSSAIFYFSASFFMERARKKQLQKIEIQIKKGLEIKRKKKFTKMNKRLVRIKMSIGIYPIAFWAPLFLSIPLGSIVTAKFYGHHRYTYPLICLGIFMNGFVITSLAYLIYG